MNPDHMPRNAARDEAPEWDGEGWPPVGAVCEGYAQDTTRSWRWRRVEILKHHGDECAVHLLDDAVLRWCDQFRPIRTPAQRAEDALADTMKAFPYGDTKEELAELVYEAIRDGKIPGIKLEGE